MRLTILALLLCCLDVVVAACGSAAERGTPRGVSPDARPSAAAGADWPHWRGPNRNDISSEDSGYDAGAWPPGEPAWTAEVGEGSTSPLVVGNQVFVMGWREEQDTLFCLDAADGQELWKVSYPAPRYGRWAIGDEGLYSGVTPTPEFDPQTGLIYTLNCDGELNCWNSRRRGQRVWGFNLYECFQAPRRHKIGRSGQRDYGYTSSPLVHGQTLIMEVGSPQGSLMGFDKRTGRRLWSSQAKEPAGHTGGAVPITVQGVSCAVVHTLEGLLVVRLDRNRQGETVARYPWQTEYANNIVTPAVHRNSVIVTSSYNHGSIARIDITLNGARRVWEYPECSKVCSPTVVGGRVYWVWQRPMCLDFETGEAVWEGPSEFGDPGSCVFTGDERMIVWARRGRLSLAETAARSPEGYRELSVKKDVLPADAWPHVVLSRGRLLVKDRRGHLKCFVLAAD